MNNSDVVRYNINASKAFDKELRELVKGQSISRFFLESAHKELKRIRRERAMKMVERMTDPLPTISDGAEYIHELRRKDTEHRLTTTEE